MPVLGQLVSLWPIFRVDPLVVSGYATTLFFTALAFMLLRRSTPATTSSGKHAIPRAQVAAGLGLIAYGAYLCVYAKYGDSYQQWKFAGLFPLLSGFLCPAAVIIALLRVQRFADYSRIVGSCFAVVALVAAMVNVSDSWSFPVYTIPRAWASMDTIDRMPDLKGAFVDLDRYQTNMAAAYLVRRKSLLIGTATYFPPVDPATFSPRPDFPVLTDKQSCVRASDAATRPLGGGFYLIYAFDLARTPLTIDFAEPACQVFVKLNNVGPAEGAFRWTTATEADALLRAPLPCCRLAVDLAVAPFLVPNRVNQQRVSLLVNGVPLGAWTLTDPGLTTLSATFDDTDSVTQGAPLSLRLELPDAVSPADMHLSGDSRALGVQLRSLRVTRLDVAASAESTH
jgi:hypothetical protein